MIDPRARTLSFIKSSPRNFIFAIDSCARTLRFIEGAGEGGVKYAGICAGPDGLLYCAPRDASSVLVIDPGTSTLSFIDGAGKAA